MKPILLLLLLLLLLLACVPAFASDGWSTAERRFWDDRASEVREINGELWSVRVWLEGQRLAGIDAPTMQAKALAYHQPGAPNFVRLRDGRQARALGEISGDVEGVTVLQGRVVSVEDGEMVLQVHVAPVRTKRIEGLSDEQAKAYKSVIRPKDDPQPVSFVPVREVDGKLVLAESEMQPVTAESLRRACAELGVKALPGYRAVKTGEEPEYGKTVFNEKLERMRYKASTFTRQDFTWHEHPVAIPLAFR